jgi:hypothetical protein
MAQRFTTILGAIALALGLSPTAVSGAMAGAGDLVGHRAVYSMALATATPGTGIVGARGAMEYRFADSCEGWIMENRTYLLVQYDEGDEMRTTWSFVTWESKDGLEYRFRVRQTRDDKVVEDLRGDALLETARGPGVARFTKPAGTRVELPAGTLFPTRHLVQLFRTAAEGGRWLGRVVFDGSALDNPFEINAFMNRVPEAERKELAVAAGLAEAPAWRMRMAFFPYGSRTPLPDFEMGVRYRADGIADKLLQDFGDFSLRVNLSEVELLPKPNC